MIERLLLAALFIVLAWIAYRMYARFLLDRRARRGLGLDAFKLGSPAILYFTTPDCLPCKTIQRPALSEIEKQFPDRLQIIEVDASSDSALANTWGVLSVPTTFLIDARGQPRGVNHGVARTDKLLRQLRELGEEPEPSMVGTAETIKLEE